MKNNIRTNRNNKTHTRLSNNKVIYLEKADELIDKVVDDETRKLYNKIRKESKLLEESIDDSIKKDIEISSSKKTIREMFGLISEIFNK